jgi:hypothetical protein
MKHSFKIILALAITITGLKLMAHEGHDHDAPTSVQAPKGGIIRKLETHFIEVVAKDKDIKIYLYSQDRIAVEPKGFKIFLKTQLPKKKTQESLSLKTENGVMSASFDAKGAHRYTLLVTIAEPNLSHQNTLKFNIEPKK